MNKPVGKGTVLICPPVSQKFYDEGTVQRMEEADNVVVMAQRTASGSLTSDDGLPPDHQECKKGKAAYFKKLGKLLERP